MPQPYEKTTSPTGDIPKPELNPMTNPVLGRHLGRWAEAYFTTPIEQREQAVVELLHQLQREEENGADPDSSPRFETRELPASVKQNLSSIDDLESPTDRLAALEEAIRQFDAPKFAADRLEENPAREREFDARTAQSPGVCPVCQHSNRLDQWYCGMCGFRLRPDDDGATRVLSFPDSAEKEAPFRRTAPTESASNEAQPTNNFSFSMFGEPLETSANRPSMWPLETVEELPTSRVGAKVAAVCVILLIAATTFVYRGKIGGFVTTWLDSRQSVPTTPQQSVAQPTPAPPANDSSAAEPQAPASASGEHAPPHANEVTSAIPTHEDRSSVSDNEKNLAGKSGTNQTPPTPEKKPLKTSASRDEADSARSAQSSGRPMIESGNEELARARALLSGGSRSADPAQASIWLWKAVGKNNGAAVILLADLYAHGNGVPQSCDQARILLSAAARKGSVEATQKLREIQTQCAGR